MFTAGVGEHAGQVREAICDGLECLGLELDAEANAVCQPDADVARAGLRGRILVIATREDVTMLRGSRPRRWESILLSQSCRKAPQANFDDRRFHTTYRLSCSSRLPGRRDCDHRRRPG